MIDILLSMIGLGQKQAHKADERFAAASSILTQIDTTTLEAAVRLDYEANRLGQMAEDLGIEKEVVISPFLSMREQNEQVRELARVSRETLKKKGANSKVIAELESWEGTCQVIPTHIDLTVKQVETVLQSATNATLRPSD